jgi:hypothetical protein
MRAQVFETRAQPRETRGKVRENSTFLGAQHFLEIRRPPGMKHRPETSAEILDSRLQDGHVVTERTEPNVALMTKNAAHCAGLVIVIYSEASTSTRLYPSAYLAASVLLSQHFVVLLQSDAVIPTQLLIPGFTQRRHAWSIRLTCLADASRPGIEKLPRDKRFADPAVTTDRGIGGVFHD